MLSQCKGLFTAFKDFTNMFLYSFAIQYTWNNFAIVINREIVLD